MEISVVVPTYNRRETVRRSLESLFAQEISPARFEIIVVVDGSTDGTADALRLLRPACRFRLIEQGNRGLAGARNTGFDVAEADLILFLDDDMLCDRHLLEEHILAHGDGRPKVAFGAIFLSADSPPSLAAECFNREVGVFHLQFKRAPGVKWQEKDCVFGNASIPRRLLKEFGGFDEEFRMREDLELGVRLFRAGVKPHYASKAIAHQYYAKSSPDLIRNAKAFAVADALFARKHPESLVNGHLSSLRNDPLWKRTLRRAAAKSPAIGDLALAPLCALGERFINVPYLRNVGVRALQLRRRIHWLHAMSRAGIS